MIHNVTPAMQKAGSDIASVLMNASIAKSMGGLGGGPTWEEWQEAAKDLANRDLVLAYVHDEIDSVTAIFIAMQRAQTSEG